MRRHRRWHLVITGRQKDIIIVNGQNYYPHDIEEIVAQLDGLDLNKVVVAGATPKGGQTEELIAFILYRQGAGRLPAADRPGTRYRRGACGLRSRYGDSCCSNPQDHEWQGAARASCWKPISTVNSTQYWANWRPCDADDDRSMRTRSSQTLSDLPRVSKDRKIGADDNLFEVGVSSLTLTEVVLAIDEKYPGKLDISDLFDYPTLREIAAFLKRDT